MISYYTHKKSGKRQGNPQIAIQYMSGDVHTVKRTKEQGKTKTDKMVTTYEFELAFEGYTNDMIKQNCPNGSLNDQYMKFLFCMKGKPSDTNN